jgi:hypothetical protein
LSRSPRLRRGKRFASQKFFDQVHRKGRAIEGSDDLRYLDFLCANANVGGERLTHILLRENPRVLEVWEEFLHGTQYRCGLIEKLGVAGAEIHVKEFMIRHQRLLGLSDNDVAILSRMLNG